MPGGQAPATDGDKGPKKPIMEQIRERAAAHGLDLNNQGGEGSISSSNPFEPASAEERQAAGLEAPPVAATPPAGTSAGGQAPPGGADAAAGDVRAAGTQTPPDGGQGTPAHPVDAGTTVPAQPPGATQGGAPAAGAAVVDSATGAPVGAAPEAEYVEVDIEDPDAGRTIKARVPKEFAEPAKGGWLRRADYTRKTQFLSKYRPMLEPMIASGEFDYVAPYLQRVTTDAAFANAVVTLFQQAVNGQPLSYGVAPPAGAPPAGTPPAAASAPAALDLSGTLAKIAQENPDLDPIALDALSRALPGVLGPVQQEIAQMRARFQQQDDQRTAFERQQQEQAQAAQARRQFAYEARLAMQQAYPAEFTGQDADFAKLQQLYAYAQEAGYIQQMGPMAGLFAAKRARDAAAAEYTGSAAAGAVAQRNALDEIQARSAQRAAADAVAAGLGGGAAGGSSAGAAATGARALAGQELRDPKTGKMLPTSAILRKFTQANANAG